MKTIAILNDVHDAEWVYSHWEDYREVVCVATHASVCDYFEPYQIRCEYLSSYLKQHELLELYAKSNEARQIFTDLDGEFGPVINELLGIGVSLDLFYDLYRYLGQYEYFNHLKLERALGRMLTIYQVEKVILFQSHFSISAPSFFSTRLNVYEMFLRKKRMILETRVSPISKKLLRREKVSHLLAKTKRSLWFFAYKFLPRLLKRFTFQAKPKDTQTGLLVFEMSAPLTGLFLALDGQNSTGFLPDVMNVNNLPVISLESGVTQGILPVELPPMDLPEVIKETLRMSQTAIAEEPVFSPKANVKAIILDDFVTNFQKYIFPIYQLSGLSLQKPILGAVWTSPPISPGPKPLIIDYLMKQGIPVVGYQHGGNYGIEHSYPRHYDSDFLWCSHYLSYGFSLPDLLETEPLHVPKCEIIPIGAHKKSEEIRRFRKKSVDIFFPISNATYFHRDTVRPLQHDLARLQRGLLHILDQLQGRRVVVKPFYLYDYPTSSFIELLRNLKNVEVVDHLDLATCFEQFEVGAVVVEYISSPLFESLRQDVEVLAIRNPLISLNPTANALLRKRVHLFNDLPELEKGMTDFLNGDLLHFRDPGFSERYLHLADKNKASPIWREMFGLSLES